MSRHPANTQVIHTCERQVFQTGGAVRAKHPGTNVRAVWGNSKTVGLIRNNGEDAFFPRIKLLEGRCWAHSGCIITD